MDEREPDIEDDPRDQQSGQGYQEEQPADASPENDDSGPDSGTGGAEERSPDTSAGQDESPSGATGNPDAAGG
jgi:hypothetical protein